MRLRVVKVQIIVIHLIKFIFIVQVFSFRTISSTIFSSLFLLLFALLGILKSIVSVKVFNPVIVCVRVSNLILNLVRIFLCWRFLAHLGRLKLLVGLSLHWCRQFGRFFHLLLELLEILLALLLSLFFSLFGTFDVNAELVTQVVCELKFFSLDIRIDLSMFLLIPTLLYILLEVSEEKEALAELNVLIERLGKTVANLLEVEVAQGRSHFL